LLAGILARIKVERTPIDLDDQPGRQPAQIGLLAGNAKVQPG
jgi:hypothetical protein